MGVPLAIAAILLVGTGLVALARDARVDAANASPVANEDEWRAAFGVYVCGEWFSSFATESGDDADSELSPDATGISSAGDGVISIAPKTAISSGQNARMGLFMDAAGIDAKKGSFELPGNESYKDGDTCTPTDSDEETEGKVVFYSWTPQANENVEPEVVKGEPDDVRFDRDGRIYALAFVPKDLEPEDMPLPPSASKLAEDAEDGANPDDPAASSTTSTPEGSTTTTAAPSSTTASSTTAAPTTTAKPAG